MKNRLILITFKTPSGNEIFHTGFINEVSGSHLYGIKEHSEDGFVIHINNIIEMQFI